jgi:hypothetical protein
VLVGQQIILEFNLETWNGIFHDAKGGSPAEYQCFLVCLVRFSSGNANFTQKKLGLAPLEAGQ